MSLSARLQQHQLRRNRCLARAAGAAGEPMKSRSRRQWRDARSRAKRTPVPRSNPFLRAFGLENKPRESHLNTGCAFARVMTFLDFIRE